MFWYLSFLRPPPVSITPKATSITITPQVANDLRTELKDSPTDIYYTWKRISPSIQKAPPYQFLTTFAPPASTYQPISVPLPPNFKLGESWCLGLSAQGDISTEAGQPIWGLLRENVGVQGCWSEGITLLRQDVLGSSGTLRGVSEEGTKRSGKEKESASKKGKGKAKEDEGPKQGRIWREWRTEPVELASRLRIIEQTSFDLDKKIWDSGLALSAWISALSGGCMDGSLNLDIHKRLRRALFHVDYTGDLKRVIEIGSGTGLVSISLAQILGHRRPDIKYDITATDLAMSLMRENIKLNRYSRDTSRDSPPFTQIEEEIRLINSTVKARVLDWDQDLPSWVSEKIDDTDWPQIVIAADVTYNTSSFPSLLSTLERLLKPVDRPAPVFLLAYKQRDIAERDLWGMLESKGIHLTHLDSVKGSEEDGQVEIWVSGITA